MKRTKIVATVGPACASDTKLKSLVQAGADIFRINASHTRDSELGLWIRRVRRASKAAGKTTGILVDLQGPRVRTGPVLSQGYITLRNGEKVSINVSKEAGSGNRITTECRQLPQMVKKHDRILLDNGFMELSVLRVHRNRVDCRVISGGLLGENKGINLPNAPITLPALTEQDHVALKTALKHNVDYIALSFVRSKKDLETVRKWMKRYRGQAPLIAKIEKPRAVRHIDDILEVADGIMVARGDLGIEMGVEKVPIIQKNLINRASAAGLPVITATQMLESMMENMRPTRAEASDIANAVLDSTDAVMLSGETAIGKHPVEAVRMMQRIISETELHAPYFGTSHNSSFTSHHILSPVAAMTHAASLAAHNLGAEAIVAFTLSGKTALAVSKLRPRQPIIAFTTSGHASRLSLYRGVRPVTTKFSQSTDEMLRRADRAMMKSKILKKGALVVVVSGRLALPGARYMCKAHRVGVYSNS